jgi:hypothetical protein
MHSVNCPLPNGSSVHLEVRGDTMNVKLTLGDGAVWRKSIFAESSADEFKASRTVWLGSIVT